MKKALTIMLLAVCSTAFAQDKKDKKDEGQQKAAVVTSRSNIKRPNNSIDKQDTVATKQARWGEKK